MKTNSLLEIDAWRTALGLAEPCVCRVELKVQGGMTYGTGFLVAPTLVMTNYHVAEAVVMGAQGKTTAGGFSPTPSDVVLRFDYKRSVEGDVVNPGVEYTLADDWLATASPLSNADLRGAAAALPAEDELDFVLLRLNEAAGDEPIGGREPGAVTRGWIELPSGARLRPEEPDLHPAAPGRNAAQARARYRCGDLSQRERDPCPLPHEHRARFLGLPVLRPELEARRPSPQRRPELRRYQAAGVRHRDPIEAIRKLVEQRGLAASLGAQEP